MGGTLKDGVRRSAWDRERGEEDQLTRLTGSCHEHLYASNPYKSKEFNPQARAPARCRATLKPWSACPIRATDQTRDRLGAAFADIACNAAPVE